MRHILKCFNKTLFKCIICRSVELVEAPKFQDNRHMTVVRLLALCSGHLYPLPPKPDIFLVIISVRGLIHRRDAVQLEVLLFKVSILNSQTGL